MSECVHTTTKTTTTTTTKTLTEDDRNVVTNANQITMPVRNVLVGGTRGDVEHDDSSMSLDAIFFFKKKNNGEEFVSLSLSRFLFFLFLTSNHHEVHRVSPDRLYPIH
jgi:hypothetical protein